MHRDFRANEKLRSSVLPIEDGSSKVESMINRRSILKTAAGAAGSLASLEAGETKTGPAAVTDSEKFRQAVIMGEIQTVTAMLDRDPALRYARDNDGVSMYTLACLHGQAKVAEELANRGLVLDVFEAAVNGNDKRANEIAKDDPGLAHHRLPDGRTALHLATAAGKPAMVILLTMRGADLSAGPDSPLLAAVDYPDHAIASEMSVFLLMNASDPNARRKRDGKTALELAHARGYDDLVEMLIHRGADPSVLPGAPVVEHAYYGRRYTQDLHGNPVTREDTYGIPQPWINQFISLAHFDFEKVKQLHKLCPMLMMTRSTWDEMAIEAAAHMGLVPMAQYFADQGVPVSACTATILGAQDLVKRLVREDPGTLRERGAHDIALLAYTAYANPQIDIADFLLNAGADVHTRSLGQTALHIAAGKGHVELAKVFLDHGADVNAVAKVQGTPLTPFALAVKAKRDKMADFLKEHGGRA
jgi:ankyrin repeat protein